MKVIFSHGRSGRPDGEKIQSLSAIATKHQCLTESVDDTDTQDPDIRAERLIATVKAQRAPFCLVGSSMGGYASLVAAESADASLLRGVFLMAPALYLPRYRQKQFIPLSCPVEIVHGWDDDVVLYEHSIRYAKQTDSTLHLLADNHRLSRQPQKLGQYFEQFLRQVINNG